MKYLTIITVIILCGILSANARKGVVVAHYGSSNDETRELTLDKITQNIKVAVGTEIIVKESYISDVVRNNLARKGINSFSPEEVFLAMRVEGIDTLIVQPSLIIDGGEMQEVRNAVEKVRPFFKHIELGHPLCYYPDDFRKVVQILSKEDAEGADAVIFVGHGNELPSTATYSQLDYMLADYGKQNYHVSTIEGYPSAETTLRQIQRSPIKIRKLKLVPFLLVCGNHTKKDIATEYSDIFKRNGYETNLLMRGLGEIDEIRDIYAGRVRNILNKY